MGADLEGLNLVELGDVQDAARDQEAAWLDPSGCTRDRRCRGEAAIAAHAEAVDALLAPRGGIEDRSGDRSGVAREGRARDRRDGEDVRSGTHGTCGLIAIGTAAVKRLPITYSPAHNAA